MHCVCATRYKINNVLVEPGTEPESYDVVIYSYYQIIMRMINRWPKSSKQKYICKR